MKTGGKEIAFRRAAWALWSFEVGLGLVALFLAIAGRAAPYEGWGFRGFPALLGIPFAVMGIMILAQRPKHAIGWLFLAFGAFASIQSALFEYMLYGLVLYPGALPGALTVAWILNSYWLVLVILMALLLLLFPDGHLPSPRWRYFIGAVVIGEIVCAILNGLTPGPLDSSFAAIDNPYALDSLSGPLATAMDLIFTGFMFISFAIPLVHLIRRIRRSSGQQRQQFKWFLFAAVILVVTSPAGPTPSIVIQSFFMAAMFFMPVAIGIAILRYRLWEIDVIIRRTLIYTLLSGILVAIYLGSVVLLQTLFRGFTGERSQAAIVLSTLGIAALFAPLRRQIQFAIDHRFYRQRYDAERTLQSFANTLREETDLEQLCGHLAGVVHETVHPDHVSIWLSRSAGE
jgi:hypothetical protein